MRNLDLLYWMDQVDNHPPIQGIKLSSRKEKKNAWKDLQVSQPKSRAKIK